MTASANLRHCVGCGARLAADNPDTACRPCQRAAQDASRRPPGVPREFWQIDRMLDALNERHMGHIVRSYRNHPFHGRKGISQEVMAHWLAIGQTQLSRIERGPPVYDLDRLVQWATTLQIPQDLLWFDLPNDEGDMKRRNFLVAGGSAALAAPVSMSEWQSGDATLTEPDVTQWLAWEMWRSGEESLPLADMPRRIAQALMTMPGVGGMILREPDGSYSFAQKSLVDFFVAQRIFASISAGESKLLATAQTSHETDKILQRYVLHERSSSDTLTDWMRKGATPVLRVNSAGILAKMGTADITDEVVRLLCGDVDTRHLYMTAVTSRVLSVPWAAAAQIAGSDGSISATVTDLSTERTSEIAALLGDEAKGSQDGAARWCSIVLLGSFGMDVPVATTMLQEALQTESSRENLRAIGNALANSHKKPTG